jgi:hypothetical protein
MKKIILNKRFFSYCKSEYSKKREAIFCGLPFFDKLVILETFYEFSMNKLLPYFEKYVIYRLVPSLYINLRKNGKERSFSV